MSDIIVSGAYLASAAAIAAAALVRAKPKPLRERLRDHELNAHIFSCVSLSAAYAVHALS